MPSGWRCWAARGFTLARIGLAEAVFHLTSLLCEVPSGVAADLLGRRLNLAVSAVFEIFSDVTMAFSPNLAAVCAAMALKALACTMISGTLEALTYDSLKTAGRENEYLQADAKISVLQKLATALGSLASLLSDVLQFAGFYLANGSDLLLLAAGGADFAGASGDRGPSCAAAESLCGI